MMKPEDKPVRTTFRYSILISRNTLDLLSNSFLDHAYVRDEQEEPSELKRLIESVEAVLVEANLEKDADNASE